MMFCIMKIYVLISKFANLSCCHMSVVCAECKCSPENCSNTDAYCNKCTQQVCCCRAIHNARTTFPRISKIKLAAAMVQDDDCCSSSVCKEKSPSMQTWTSTSRLTQFMRNVKNLYAAALGIEILCIAAAETGENTGLYVLGFNHIGVPLAYAMGYGLATFTTFATILGRYQYGSGSKIDGCCSVLEQEESN